MRQGKHIASDGTERWYKNGRLHRPDGPAITYPDGTERWYKDGELHRLDGLANAHSDGTESWWIGHALWPAQSREWWERDL